MIVAYVYDIAGNVVNQFFDVYSLVTEQNINGYDTGSFDAYYKDGANKTLFHLGYRVKVCELVDDNVEKLYIDGYIVARKPMAEKMSVVLKGYEWFFDRTVLATNKSYNGTVQSIINDIVAHYNSRYNRGLTHSCTVATTWVGTFSAGSTIAEMLRRIAEAGYEYKVVDNVLLFGVDIGTDYTQPPLDPIYLNTDYLDFDGVNDYVKTDATFYQSGETFAISGNVTEDNGAFVFAGDRNNTTATGTNANISLGNPNLTQATDFEIQIDFTYDTDVLGTTNRYSGLVGDATDFSLGFFNADRKVRLISKPTYSSYIGPTLTVGQRYVYNVKYNAIENKAYLYQGGVLLNAGGTAMSPTFTLNSFHVGDLGSEYGSPASNNKKVYDCKLWDRMLSDAERADSVNGVVIDDGLIKWINGKHFLQNNTTLTHCIDLVNSQNRLLPCDNIVFAFDFRIDSDGTASTASLGLFATPFLVCHVRETNNQVQFRYDNTGAVIASTTNTTLGNGDRKRHRCVCIIFRYGNTTRLGCIIDDNTIAFSESTKVPYQGKGISPATAVYFGYGMGYGDVKIKNFDVYKFDVVDNNTYGIDYDDLIRLTNRETPTNTASLVKFLSYDMHEGTGTVLNDLSGNGRNATLYNGTAWAQDTTAPFVVEVPQFSPDPVILKYDVRDPSDNNIDDVAILIDAELLVNAPYNPSIGFIDDATSITEFGRLEQNITGSGDITAQRAKILAQQKDEVVQADLKASIQDFNALEIGDKVAVFVFLGDGQDNYNDTSKVIKKTYNNGKAEMYLSKNTVKSKSILEIIDEHERKIATIENV